MKKSAIVLFLFAYFAKASAVPGIRYEDKIRITKAYEIAKLYGDKIGDNWDKTPFALLLIYDDNEFLINRPSPSADFKLIGFDSLLKSNVYYRKRVFSTQFLATFPAVNNIPTIVVGTPENTRKSTVDWIITILHEHFHQYQYSHPNYYNSVNKLDLSGGDSTGMWMLNYPFPYEDIKINTVYDSCKKTLAQIFKSNDESIFKTLYETFKEKRASLVKSLGENDYKYFSFQLWQEGIARYTEIKLMQLMLADDYVFSKEIRNLKDYKPLKDHYKNYYTNALNLVDGLSLMDSKRICFYAFGAFEGLLLDKVNPNWKKDYFNKKFFLEKYYPD